MVPSLTSTLQVTLGENKCSRNWLPTHEDQGSGLRCPLRRIINVSLIHYCDIPWGSPGLGPITCPLGVLSFLLTWGQLPDSPATVNRSIPLAAQAGPRVPLQVSNRHAHQENAGGLGWKPWSVSVAYQQRVLLVLPLTPTFKRHSAGSL